MVSRAFLIRVPVVLPAAVALHLFIGDRVRLGADVGGVGALVTAVGTLYSVLTAFRLSIRESRSFHSRTELAISSARMSALSSSFSVASTHSSR